MTPQQTAEQLVIEWEVDTGWSLDSPIFVNLTHRIAEALERGNEKIEPVAFMWTALGDWRFNSERPDFSMFQDPPKVIRSMSHSENGRQSKPSTPSSSPE